VADNIMSQAVTFGGDYAMAALLIAEADAVREATGALVGPYGALVLAAYRGVEEEARVLIDATITEATSGGQGTAVQFAHYTNAVVKNAGGHYEEALAAAIKAADDTPELVVARWSLNELIEAASRTQSTDAGEDALARLGDHANGSDTDWALGSLARAQALLSDGEEAERLYREAIERFGRTPLRPELGRTQLLYGEWLRRENRRTDAREQLRSAHHAFLSMGADGFAERARNELVSTGEKVRKRTVETRDELTAQEAQIARLAAEGYTNPEIGAKLFLSPRTVEWHLRKVFSKLGITSRRQLGSALPEAGRAAVPA
jgi:DNA-binding CsgD family transcriptional regulator